MKEMPVSFFSNAKPLIRLCNFTDRKENWTPFAPQTYAYPFSALNVAGAAANLPPPIKTAHLDGESGGRGQAPPQEPKPLLSAQYEALSDED